MRITIALIVCMILGKLFGCVVDLRAFAVGISCFGVEV